MLRSRLTFLFVFITLTACTNFTPPDQFLVISHPDGSLFVGDQVSFEVLIPGSPANPNSSIKVEYNGNELGTANISPYGIGGRRQATLLWVWDTRNLKPGNYNLVFTHLPDNFTWTETFSLHPKAQVPMPEPDAHWVTSTTVCCNLYYISDTAAARDITILGQEADIQSAAVSGQFGASLKERINITIMSRVVGQGGFTNNGIYVSYLDDNYIGNDMPILFHHEFVHYYDRNLGGSYLPAILEEGLAVYLTGGHFKPERLGPRAAALLELGWYIPLTTIADDFYIQQHDISYLEAGSLVQYLVETFGWEKFNKYYRSIPVPQNQTIAAVIDLALQNDFGISLFDLERAYLSYLHSQTVTADERTDLQQTVSFFDTVRRYQEAFDPSSYFLSAWLPDGSVMRQRGIVADFLRHPNGWKNRLLESMLIRSHNELFRGDYPNTESTLKWTNWTMEVINP